jgi:hypothetical protein
MDSVVDQALEYIYKDENLKEKVFRPVKRKAYPYLLGGLVFNFVILFILIFLVFRVNAISHNLTVEKFA